MTTVLPRIASAALAFAVVLATPAPSLAQSTPPRLEAGVGRADITPPTGYPLGGWVRADRTGNGVHTRLQASALVLKSGGVPFLTGSEEGRGPLFDLTGIPFEGLRAPVEGFESQGHKIGVPGALSPESYPIAVPLFVVRIADQMIVSLPAEPTVEVGRRARAAVVAAARGSGVRGAIVSGLANEFIQYLTTPEEYDRQHYEGGSTIFGPASAALLTEQLAELAGRLVRGRPAQQAYAFDPRNGVVANGEPFGTGVAAGEPLRQPIDTPPGSQAVFDWRGAPNGLDRPLDRPFVSIQRRGPRGWRPVADDLGLAIVWTADAEGRYSMHWQVPRRARSGRHRAVVSANRYRLRSRSFAVDRSAPAVVIDPDHPASEFGPITRR